MYGNNGWANSKWGADYGLSGITTPVTAISPITMEDIEQTLADMRSEYKYVPAVEVMKDGKTVKIREGELNISITKDEILEMLKTHYPEKLL